LKELGAWQYIESRSQPYQCMQIWEAMGPGFVRISSDEAEADCLGDDNNALYMHIADNMIRRYMMIVMMMMHDDSDDDA